MSIKYEKDSQNIATLTFDKPGSPVNLVDALLVETLFKHLDSLESDSSLTGIIITSNKKDFLAGADIDRLYAIKDTDEAVFMVDAFKKALRRLETLGKPVAAAMNGSALGGGYELALACHRRICMDNPKIEIGFPEVTLGILPAGGGTQRFPRLIGVQKGLPYLMEGKRIRPEEALKNGLVDELASDRDDLIKKAVQWIKDNPEAKQPWDSDNFRWPGGDPKSPNMVQMWAIAPSFANKKTYGNYPAVKNILSSVYEGGQVDFETGCRIESKYFAELAAGKTSKNMINTFWYQLNGIKKGKSRPDGFEKYSVKKVGILGAGMMGSGIAYVSALAGIDVVLKDVDMKTAEKGRAHSAELLNKRVSRGKMTEEKKGEILSRIKATGKAQDLDGCDLVIEAVFEDRNLKAEVTAEAEKYMLPDGVFASNTSTLPITGLAEKSGRPQQFIGLHFFSPVHRMPLVEIIVGKKTGKETLAKAFDYVLQIKKTPIVVNDSRGFYTSRVFRTYTMEGLGLLTEGQDPATIEAASLKAGMPIGPLAVSDEVSLSLMLHISEQTKKDLEEEGVKMPDVPGMKLVERMVNEYERAGKKAGKGFYDYPEKGEKRLWPGLWDLYPARGKQYSQEEMIDRILFVQVLETIRCYEEKVLTTTADANIGSIFGWGFPPFKGGTLQFVNDYGVKEFLNRSKELADEYGERFNPPELLVKMADKNEKFE